MRKKIITKHFTKKYCLRELIGMIISYQAIKQQKYLGASKHNQKMKKTSKAKT